ncbi:zinc metallopeptidase [Carboxylicivirga sp. M1479]|uniref:zinc metallopeptidase n=1 Tax=Carboxylicivirga sp. M1479 TaxID=2594476 RepID=UPI0011783A37|nr:zinc metallopeptidase [Carboxylicivirga sp. M1479]TRX72210.1 zinc metallopeptidase [Carboxylicivirga sp. M1479]
MFSSSLLFIFIFFLALSWLVSSRLKSKFKAYSQIPINFGMTGKEVAEKMLYQNGLMNVQVNCVSGQLSDHYNPSNRSINLSPDVYNGRSVASAAVAAHETGHAVQHAKSYAFLEFRSALVPVQNISAKVLNFMFIAMFIGAFALPGMISYNLALQIIIACYGVFTLAAFITLPVEIDASRRALAWLNTAGITTQETHGKAKDALKWAAYTYVVAALSALATLLYYVMLFVGNRD